MKYISEGVQRPPQPHIMVVGPTGCGSTTQIEKICEKYNVPQFNLKDEFLAKLRAEKEERKRQRLLNRGFKAPEPVEDDDEEGPPPDPEIEDDPEEFDKEAHERDVLRSILDANSVLIIDGSWFDLPEDEVTMGITELLFEARRPPELVINLSVSEDKMLARLLNNDEIEGRYQELVDKRNEEKRQKREEDRQAKLEELQGDEEKTPEEIESEMQEWDKERDEEEENDDDPDAPNLEEMLTEEKEKLIEARNTQEEQLAEFVERVAEKKVPVVNIDGNLEIERVHLRILNDLKPYIEDRNSMFERSQIVDLKAAEVKFYENSYLHQLSKYGYKTLFDIGKPDMTKEFSLLYRDRLYFFSDQDEKDQFVKTPDVFTQHSSVPKDVWIKPICFVLGTPYSGKSTVAETLAQRTGAVHLKIEEIIPEFIEANCELGQSLRDEIKGGQPISEDLMVEIIMKRVQFSDCIDSGYILEDFPKTKSQAEKLSLNHIVPDYVFYINMYSEQCYNRADGLTKYDFMVDPRVFSERLTTHLAENSHVCSYYEQHYGSVKYINGLKSKWYVEDTILEHVRDALLSKSDFARRILDPTNACILGSINVDRQLMHMCHSKYGYFCPVTWKNHATFSSSRFMEETAVIYQPPGSDMFHLYFFRNIEQRDMFVDNPSLFIKDIVFPSLSDIPQQIEVHNAAQIVTKEKNLANYCPVSLLEEDRIVKGYPLYLVYYNESKFVFESSQKLVRFMGSPTRYAKVTLPVKMPPINDKITLLSFTEANEDAIALLEQSVGAIATRALLEITSCRVKYPTLSVKETALKLFAMFLKANNPSNTEYTRQKYIKKIRTFMDRCELPRTIYKLKKKKGKLSQ